MELENVSPIIVTIGPVSLRWYGLLFALAMGSGYYYLQRNGKAAGYGEEYLLGLFLVIVLAAIAGARALFVITNYSFFAANPELILRVDRGGLAFHGGLLGAMAATLIYCRQRGGSWLELADLAVPGLCLGIILVRIGNIFNGEILGREAALLPFTRHPAQVYGILIGISLLVLHNQLARRADFGRGGLFWVFFLGYALLRALVEETFRDNPIIAWGYVSDAWGTGFFTAVQLATPLFVALAIFMLRHVSRSGLEP